MTDPSAFAKLVPGFDFLQGLVKNAGAALPNVGQWIAPTLNPEELEKRIEELRTVQFWLEQNARMLGATIQALEVQRMTLSTLKSMNVSLGDLSESLKIRMPEARTARSAKPDDAGAAAAADSADSADSAASAASADSDATAGAKKSAPRRSGAAPGAPIVPPGVADPMQWWGALTKQFTELAANAMKDSATDAAKNLAGQMVKQSFDAAGETLKKAATMPMAVAKGAASAAHSVAKGAVGAVGAVGAARRPAAAPKKPAARRR